MEQAKRQRRPLRLHEWRRAHLPGQPHKVLCDDEVTEFVDSALEAGTSFEKIAAACRVRFAASRAPSKAAIHRYWIAFRRVEARKRIRAARSPR
jgi:hypothetical protein